MIGVKQTSEIVTHNGRLYHLGFAPEEVAASVFLVGDPARAYKVAAHFDSLEHEVKNREYVTLTGSFKEIPMSVIGTGIGTDNVEIALIELHAAHAMDLESGEPQPGTQPLDIIRIGTSGGVQPDLAAGSLCIAEYALGLDSTGPYYTVPAADSTVIEIEKAAESLLNAATDSAARFRDHLRPYASKAHPQVHDLLLRHARSTGEPFASGITVSAPGFYGPSSRRIAGLRNTVPDIKGTLAALSIDDRKVLNMEMESSLLFHLAGALGHRAGTICPSISQPDESADLFDYNASIETAISVALGAMVELRSLPQVSQLS
jgi:uridine phosphorylase